MALLSAANFTTIDAAPLSIWGPVGKDINLGSRAGLLFAWNTMLLASVATIKLVTQPCSRKTISSLRVSVMQLTFRRPYCSVSKKVSLPAMGSLEAAQRGLGPRLSSTKFGGRAIVDESTKERVVPFEVACSLPERSA